MNKLTIPTILVATIMVAGIFAFMPVDNASTIHFSTGLATTMFSTQITLEDDTSEFVTFSATTDSVVIGILADPSSTAGTEKDFNLCAINSGDRILFRGLMESNSGDDDGIFCENIADGGDEGQNLNQNDKDEQFDVINVLANWSQGHRFMIPVEAGDDLVLGFYAENADDTDVILDLTITVIGGGTLSQTSNTPPE